MRTVRTCIRIVVLLLPVIVVLNGQSEGQPWAEKVTVRVDGLACPFCAYGVERKLERLEGVDDLDIRINEGLVILYSKENGSIDEVLIRQKVKEAGFTPREIERETEESVSGTNEKDGLETIHLSIDGMRCSYCVLNIETALKDIEGVEDVAVNLEDKSAEVVVKKGKVTAKTLIEAVASLASFKATVKK